MMALFLELIGTLLIFLSYHVGRIVNINFGTDSGDSSTLLRLTITSFSRLDGVQMGSTAQSAHSACLNYGIRLVGPVHCQNIVYDELYY